MSDPFAPLRRLADTNNITTTDTEDLQRQMKQLTEALDTLPDVHATMRAARQAIGAELHTTRNLSYRKLAETISRSPTRVKQIIEGERASGRNRKPSTADDEADVNP